MQGRVLLSSSPPVQLKWWYKGRRDLFLCVLRLPPAFELSFFRVQSSKIIVLRNRKILPTVHHPPCLGMARNQMPTLCLPETKVI
jgi:hypothetical protein